MPIIYDSKKIIPAPYFSATKSYIRAGDTSTIGAVYNINLIGTLVSCKGSPNSSGGWWDQSGYPPDETTSDKFHALLVKQQALRELFTQNGKALEIQAWDGSAPLICYPRVKDINFPEGPLTEDSKYTISLEAPRFYLAGVSSSGDISNNPDVFYVGDTPTYLTDVKETWGLETLDDTFSTAQTISTLGYNTAHLYRLALNLSAVGKEVYDSDGKDCAGWQQAQKWVVDRIGQDNSYLYLTSGIHLPSYYDTYNHSIIENTDEQAGSYSITENWLVSSGTAKDDFNVSIKTSMNQGTTQVSIEGLITGYEKSLSGIITTSKWQSAYTHYAGLLVGDPTHTIYNRALNFSSLAYLNLKPVNTMCGENISNGTINYSYEYDNRPSNYIANSLYENITFQSVYPTDVFASIPVIGRQAGPVLQDMNTYTDTKKALSIEVVMPVGNSAFLTSLTDAPYSTVQVLLDSYDAYLKTIYTSVFVSRNDSSWSPTVGRFSRNVEWTVESCS